MSHVVIDDYEVKSARKIYVRVDFVSQLEYFSFQVLRYAQSKLIVRLILKVDKFVLQQELNSLDSNRDDKNRRKHRRLKVLHLRENSS